MISEKFKALLKQLNKEQREAVETIYGPVMVAAGPGTGKTQILTLRVANILAKTDAGPENILALTFTESAAANMRRRLVGLIGSAGYYAEISTFHGFCNGLIKNYPENFPRIIGSKNISPANQIALVRDIIEKTNLKHLKPFGDKFYYAGEILSAIKKLKNEGWNPDEFKKIAAGEAKSKTAEKTARRQKELALAYQKYQQELALSKLYDFDDMVLETIAALKKNSDFLLDLREQYQYILVDEHQDTNGGQNQVLELLAGYDNSPSLFVVGDEKQAIFRFQGANLENFLYFKKKYPAAKLIELKNNYRSTQNILDASHSLIEKNRAVLALTQLKARSDLPGRSDLEKIKVVSLPNTETEQIFVAQKTEELIKSGHKPGEIAIIYRDNKDAAPLAEALERRGIPFAVESDENILEDAEIKKLNALFAAIASFPSAEHLMPALHADFLNINPLEIYKFLQGPTFPGRSDLPPAVTRTVQKIGGWKKASFNLPLPKFFETVMRESGFLKNILTRADYHHRLVRLNTLFKEIKALHAENPDAVLADYLKHLEVLKEHRLPLQSKHQSHPEVARLMTAHRAKGLEFETVFITGAVNGHWGNRRRPDYFGLTDLISAGSDFDKNEDERRLFYMALTRAKKNIFVSYSAFSAEGREQVPSQFIAEIRPDLREEEQIIAHQGLTLASPRSDLGAKPKNDEQTFVKEMFSKRGLSPTSLNNYLACPWRFFYVNLLRVPQTPTRHQIYGTAKHAALETFFEHKKANPRAGRKILTQRFTEVLKTQPLAASDHENIRQKGLETLAAYHDFYKNNWNYNTVNEFKIAGVNFPFGQKEPIRLTGKLDKLEILSPTSNFRLPTSVVVVDYKTKAPESRNWILGQTKNSTGDYFRQLVFYKLLLDLLPRKKYHMETGVIDFTEPLDSHSTSSGQAARGKPAFKKEIFEISPADLSHLKDLISQTADEILNLKFWNKRCEDKKCQYCELREFLPKKLTK